MISIYFNFNKINDIIIAKKNTINRTKLTHNFELSSNIKKTSANINNIIILDIKLIINTVIPKIFSPTNTSNGPIIIPNKKIIHLNFAIKSNIALFNS